MANDIDAAILHVLSRIREIPTRLDAALKQFEDKLAQAGAELQAAKTLADTIVANATKAARELDTKTAALNAAFKETAKNIAAG